MTLNDKVMISIIQTDRDLVNLSVRFLDYKWFWYGRADNYRKSSWWKLSLLFWHFWTNSWMTDETSYCSNDISLIISPFVIQSFSICFQLDGEKTLGENIADNGGLKESFRVRYYDKYILKQYEYVPLERCHISVMACQITGNWIVCSPGSWFNI